MLIALVAFGVEGGETWRNFNPVSVFCPQWGARCGLGACRNEGARAGNALRWRKLATLLKRAAHAQLKQMSARASLWRPKKACGPQGVLQVQKFTFYDLPGPEWPPPNKNIPTSVPSELSSSIHTQANNKSPNTHGGTINPVLYTWESPTPLHQSHRSAAAIFHACVD